MLRKNKQKRFILRTGLYPRVSIFRGVLCSFRGFRRRSFGAMPRQETKEGIFEKCIILSIIKKEWGKMKILTWNMQGANSETLSKWNVAVIHYFNAGYDFICLQECGKCPWPPLKKENPTRKKYPTRKKDPTREEDTDDLIKFPHHPKGTVVSGGFVRYHQKILGSSTRGKYYAFAVVYSWWDGRDKRCNMAIVSRIKKPPFEVIWNKNPPYHRPALSIMVQDPYEVKASIRIATIHAKPGGGIERGSSVAKKNALGLIEKFYRLGLYWFIAGDFNCNPNDFNCNPNDLKDDRDLPRGAYIATQRMSTHSGGGILDYAVTSIPGVSVTILPRYISDHQAVALGFHTPSRIERTIPSERTPLAAYDRCFDNVVGRGSPSCFPPRRIGGPPAPYVFGQPHSPVTRRSMPQFVHHQGGSPHRRPSPRLHRQLFSGPQAPPDFPLDGDGDAVIFE